MSETSEDRLQRYKCRLGDEFGTAFYGLTQRMDMESDAI